MKRLITFVLACTMLFSFAQVIMTANAEEVFGVEPTENLVSILDTGWVYGRYDTGAPSYRGEDGSIQLSGGGVAFTGKKAGNSEKITVKLSGTRVSTSGWAAIQFRGNLTAEMAATKEIFYSENNGHTGLALLLRKDGKLSINDTNGNNGAQKNWSGSVSAGENGWYDGNDHIIDIVTAAAEPSGIKVTVFFDGQKVIDGCQIDGFTEESYISIVSNSVLDTLSVKSLGIGNWKTTDFTEKPQEENLLQAGKAYWTFAGDTTDKGLVEDGTIKLSNTFATFSGKQVGAQKITVIFAANLTDWAAIQFRGNISPEQAVDTVHIPYYSTENDGLALVIKNSGRQISINGGNGEGVPVRLSDNVDVNLADGNDHVVDVITVDREDGKIGITVQIDGENKLSYTAEGKYKRTGYVTIACQRNTDMLIVKSLQIAGFKVSDFPEIEEKPTEPEEKPTEPEEKPTEPEETPTTGENLLQVDRDYWIFAGNTSDNGFMEDGTLRLGNTFATFAGKQVGAQKIIVKLSASLTDWAAIQFRGALTSEQALDTVLVPYYSTANQGLALVIKNGGSQISINGGNGEGVPVRLSDNVDVNLADGKDHIIEIITVDQVDGKVDIRVIIDGECKLTYIADARYQAPGFVTLACQKNTDILTVKSFQIAGTRLTDFPEIEAQESEYGKSPEENLLKTTDRYWGYGNYSASPMTYKQDDGTFRLKGSGVAFLGDKAANGDKITVKFSATRDSTAGWAAIQFRGNMTADYANSQDIFYSENKGHIGLAVLLRGDGKISINDTNGNANGTQKNWSGSVEVGGWADGKDHIIDIVTEDVGDGILAVSVYYDGILIINKCQVKEFNAPSYISVVSNNIKDTLILKELGIGQLKVDDYQLPDEKPTVGSTPVGNLLNATPDYWAFADYESTQRLNAKQEDGCMSLNNMMATFVGAKAGSQQITVKFSAQMPASKGWAAVQFRGGVSAEEACTADAVYFSAANNALAVVIKNGGTELSLNGRNANGNPFRLSENVTGLHLADGKDHILDIVSNKRADGKIKLEIYVDGQLKISYIADNCYDMSGYVTVASSHPDNTLCLKNLGISGFSPASYQTPGQEWTYGRFVYAKVDLQLEQNFLEGGSDYWIIGSNGSKVAFTSQNTLTIAPSYGLATFTDTVVDDQMIVFKFISNVTSNIGVITFRNNVTLPELQQDGQNGWLLNADIRALAVLIKPTQIALNVSDGHGNWKRLGDNTELNVNDGQEHIMGIQSWEENGKLVISVIVDGIEYIHYTYEEVLPAGYVSFHCISSMDALSVTGFEIKGHQLSEISQRPTQDATTEPAATITEPMLMYGKEANNQKQDKDSRPTAIP